MQIFKRKKWKKKNTEEAKEKKKQKKTANLMSQSTMPLFSLALENTLKGKKYGTR